MIDPSKLIDSPVESHLFRDWKLFIKRDDYFPSPLDGNKARKLYALYLTPASAYRAVVSYGGNQSNAMHALASLASLKGWEFHYFTRPLSRLLRENPLGNLGAALGLGMKLHESLDPAGESRAFGLDSDTSTLFIPQGVACTLAREGAKQLARELEAFIREQRLENPAVFTSSGTGTSALYLAQESTLFELFTTPCVGSAEYLVEQMLSLLPVPARLPTILPLPLKIPFGKPHARVLEVYNEWRALGIEFDLLYDSPAWLALWEARERFGARPVIFIHSGATFGNATQLARYAR